VDETLLGRNAELEAELAAANARIAELAARGQRGDGHAAV